MFLLTDRAGPQLVLLKAVNTSWPSGRILVMK